MSPAEWIYWLGRGMPDASRLGGKAAGLDRLLRLDFPVPPGFCITTAAYEHYFDEMHLGATIVELTSQLPAAEARQALAALSRRHPFPADLTAALARAMAALAAEAPGGLFAVRSSAVGEDAHGASYAGQHETILGVHPAGIEDAVRRCWASLWSERAVAYRLRRKLGFTDALMAVVVQPTLPADASAVVFTRNPVSGRDDEILVNATRGLGEAIVSGEITPDTITLDKSTLGIRQIVPGDKPHWLRLAPGGVVETIHAETPAPALSDDQIQTLGALAVRAERALGAPVDLEAAHAHGRWFLLQARPITT